MSPKMYLLSILIPQNNGYPEDRFLGALQFIIFLILENRAANESSLVFSAYNQTPENERLLLSNDITNLILTTRTKDHMKVTQHAMKHFVKTKEPFRDSAVLLKKRQLLKDFMLTCRLHKWKDTANSTWNDDHFMELAGFTDQGSNQLAMNMPTVTLCYLDILYEKKLYQAVIDEILKLEKVVQLPVFVYVLGMMACLKMNTEESLNVATAFYNGSSNKQIMKISRVVHPYSLLMHKQGNTSLALETVSLLPTKHFPYLRAGIMVHFLSHLNRPDEACSLLEVMLRNYDRADKPLAMARGQGIPKLIFSMETVKSLTDVIRTHKDAALNARLGGVFSRLDKIASITDQSIDNLVTAEIDISSFEKARKLKYLKKWERQIDDADADIEDIDQLEDSQHR